MSEPEPNETRAQWEEKFLAALFLHGLRLRVNCLAGIDKERVSALARDIEDMPEAWAMDWALSRFDYR
ncbi:MAG: hypothetical protein K1X79_02560 [Oligoflexia bacterium]|nr:hypothetical protein [Oligoflexia bacterium]